jgi:hypothetical protein
MKINEIIQESADALHGEVVKAVLDSIKELIGQGHTEVATHVLTNAVVARLGKPFMPKDLVSINKTSSAVQHYIDSINPNKVKFSADILTVKNEDPKKEKDDGHAIVGQMASRRASKA